MSLFPQAKHVQLISVRKNHPYSPGTQGYFLGGGHLIFTNPDLGMNSYWLKEKIKTGFKRQVRKIL